MDNSILFNRNTLYGSALRNTTPADFLRTIRPHEGGEEDPIETRNSGESRRLSGIDVGTGTYALCPGRHKVLFQRAAEQIHLLLFDGDDCRCRLIDQFSVMRSEDYASFEVV